MGEVYRARDLNLERDVAVKILPANFSEDAERLQRFEQEARAVSSIQHPNILNVYDFGKENGNSYIVSELLEGETLRSKLEQGLLPIRKSIDYGLQIAKGLAAAHDRGIVHRDLKPENIFVLKDGHLKILDFGLAKLIPQLQGSTSELVTQQRATEPGIVMGTVGYMSPEQVKGKAADHRTDIFSFGAVLYEMLAGHHPFPGDTTVERLNAILKTDPPPMAQTNPNLSPALERVVQRCLEKSPAERFQSCTDLAFALDALSHLSGTNQAKALKVSPLQKRMPVWMALIAMALLLLVIFLGIRRMPRIRGPEPITESNQPAVFRRLSFRRGNILHARFLPDGKSVVYGASFEGNPTELFVTSPANPESRALGYKNADIASVSKDGELAILQRTGFLRATRGLAVLARVPMNGGSAPRQIIDKVGSADWLPDGKSLAVSRLLDNNEWVLEFPIGNVVYKSKNPIESIRVSPDGNSVSFQQSLDFDSGIGIVDRNGKSRIIFRGNLDTQVWSRSGKEILLLIRSEDQGPYLGAVSMDGKTRHLLSIPDGVPIHDIAQDGTLLTEVERFSSGILFRGPDDKEERDLSWLSSSDLVTISGDGSTILFNERPDIVGALTSLYMRATDGSPAVKLADSSYGGNISPDGNWVLGFTLPPPAAPVLIPVGVGEMRTLKTPGLDCFGGNFYPDQKSIIVLAADQKGDRKPYRIEIATNKIEKLIEDGRLGSGIASPDFKTFALFWNGQAVLYDPVSGKSTPLPNIPDDLEFERWSQDGRSFYLFLPFSLPTKVYKYDIASAKLTEWKTISPADPTIIRIDNIEITPDGKSYGYTFSRVLSSDLYTVRGLK